ncbi:MAG: hypothetical protein L3J09_09665 [Flavobacteriaceae bacterium]|nr:hypothetical protein [Flavobacteriaceae bacterium]
MNLLIYSQKITPRITYVFKHICTRILGIEIGFTSQIEEFIAYSGAKLSYGKKPMGNEFFVQSYGLLTQQGFDDIEITVKEWEETKCFFSAGIASQLPFDIFSASFYLLSRYEEYLPHVKDEKGRFLATESIAFKNEFLQKPVVDIWAYKFKNILADAFPQLVFLSRKITYHTVINASQPFIYRHKGFLRSFSGIIKDLSKLKFKAVFYRFGSLLGFKADPYTTFDWLINLLKIKKFKITVFFIIGESVNFEEGMNSNRNAFKLLVKNIADYMQVGILFSKKYLLEVNELKVEKEKIEAITNRNLISSMNEEYLVNLPDNYRSLIELEIEKDFTMVYENVIGFRASTCTPFLFYDLDYEIVTPLLIQPISLTTRGLKGVSVSERDEAIIKIERSVKQVNGIFSMIFNNNDFMEINNDSNWKSVLLNLTNNE